ncbi:hypothetical protein GCM10011487_19950 [Steroidobacter agaridevorans]|uniref:Uncharacterized protein n=1 Tax=Steroidobacter agaridevorans TaxID=2695856 RepID=A0A829YAD2_9GAMM|nr:hypothetical protein [Steroidobacter agaridevorans]GFE79995.1 hypothetical protein GCM10011487_19950 [Steroidobacter agaridevorans]GFE90035.1 hypothetical protein GCM10011488_49890 [Steroidobacter agaridevorans]
MDRAIVLCVLLLVGLTWLLYKLTILLEPRAEPPPASQNIHGNSSQKLIHQRLRK